MVSYRALMPFCPPPATLPPHCLPVFPLPCKHGGSRRHWGGLLPYLPRAEGPGELCGTALGRMAPLYIPVWGQFTAPLRQAALALLCAFKSWGGKLQRGAVSSLCVCLSSSRWGSCVSAFQQNVTFPTSPLCPKSVNPRFPTVPAKRHSFSTMWAAMLSVV